MKIIKYWKKDRNNERVFDLLNIGHEDVVTICYEEGNPEYLIQGYGDSIDLINNVMDVVDCIPELEVGEVVDEVYVCYEDEFEDWFEINSQMTIEEAKKALAGYFAYFEDDSQEKTDNEGSKEPKTVIPEEFKGDLHGEPCKCCGGHKYLHGWYGNQFFEYMLVKCPVCNDEDPHGLQWNPDHKCWDEVPGDDLEMSYSRMEDSYAESVFYFQELEKTHGEDVVMQYRWYLHCIDDSLSFEEWLKHKREQSLSC